MAAEVPSPEQQELEILQQTLREIAQAIISDAASVTKITTNASADVVDAIGDTSLEHSILAQSPSKPKSPSKSSPRRQTKYRSIPSATNVPQLAESTINAVEAALDKRQQQIQVSLTSNNIIISAMIELVGAIN